MQQLEERNTYAPTDIPHVRSNCGLALNRGFQEAVEETLGVSCLKTSSNNSDAALTGKRSTRTELASICWKTPPLLIKEYDRRFVNPASINARQGANSSPTFQLRLGSPTSSTLPLRLRLDPTKMKYSDAKIKSFIVDMYSNVGIEIPDSMDLLSANKLQEEYPLDPFDAIGLSIIQSTDSVSLVSRDADFLK